MAIAKDVKAADGGIRKNAYFSPYQLFMDIRRKTGSVNIEGYNSKEDRDAGAEAIAGTQLPFEFTPEEFIAAQTMTLAQLGLPNASGQTTLYEVLGRFMYGVVKSRKTVPVLNEDGSPVTDDDGNPVMRSFFEGGQDV